MSNKLEIRGAVKDMETRNNSGEFRSIEEDGTFEGYLTVWNTTDDYNSEFQRGAFKKTIQERGSKVKIFYDHEHLIGSSIELREDDHGLFGRGKLNLDVDKAQEAYAFMKDGTLDGLSFGFRTIKEGFANGVRQIKEAKLYEFGPVVFPANDEALITGVRSENFGETLDEDELRRKRWVLRDALEDTLNDIWWSDTSNKDNIIGKMDAAIADFHGAYLEFVAEWVGRFWVEDGLRSSPIGNELSNSMNEMMAETRQSVEELAGKSKFTVDELKELRKGNLIENRGELSTLSESIAASHREVRNAAVETLCTELRAGLTDSERKRVLALLKPVEVRQSEPTPDTDIADMLAYYQNEQTIGEQ